MRHLLPVLLVLGYAGAASPAARAVHIYKTGFEPPLFSPGVLAGQDGWFSDIGPADNIMIQTDMTLTGTQAVAIDANGARSFTRAVRYTHFDTALSEKKLIRLRVAMYLTSSDQPSEWRITGDEALGSTGYQYIGLAGVSSTGALFVWGDVYRYTGITVTRDVWHTYELRFHFDTRTFDLLFDDQVVAVDQPFSAAGTSSSVFQTVLFEVVSPGTDQAFFDNLVVTAQRP